MSAPCPTCGVAPPPPCETCQHFRPARIIGQGEHEFEVPAHCKRENARVIYARSRDGDCRAAGEFWAAREDGK